MASLVGIRIVARDWGPRGFAAALRDAKARGFAPTTVIDVGAAAGTWTTECRAIFPDAAYLLIDPLPANRAILERFAAQEGLHVWSGAVGPEAGSLTLYEHGDQTSALRSDDFTGPALTVEQRTLDSLVAEHDLAAPLLVKIDVQGMELKVLEGASRTLELAELLLVEVNLLETYEGASLAHEVICYLAARGFRILDFCSYIQRPRDGALAQSDLLFVQDGSRSAAKGGWR